MWVKFSRQNSEIAVYCENKCIIDKLSLLLAAFFNMTEIKEPKNLWKIILGNTTEIPKKSKINKMHVDTMTTLGEPRRQFVIFPNIKTIFITEPKEDYWQIQYGLRLIRGLSRELQNESGMIFFHGGMVSYKNNGICFMGHGKTGKTSAILTLLGAKKADFVSNDDLSVSFRDHKIIGYGWPRSIAVRNDTFDVLKDLNFPSNLAHPTNRGTQKEKFTFFYPHELVECFGTHLLSESTVDYIFFTKFTKDKPQIETLEKNEFYSLLKEQVLESINKYSKKISRFFIPIDEKIIENCLQLMIQKIQGFKFRQNFTKMNEGINLLTKLIDKN